MNPVVNFLTTRKGYTFEEGVAFFAKFTANRFAVERVRRSRDMRLLQQELKKLAHVPGLKPVNGCQVDVPKEAVPVPTPNETVPTPEEPVSNVPEIVEPLIEKVVENIESEVTTKDNVTYAELQHYKFTRFNDMPTTETQQLWQRNNNRWHRKIDLFAKMKLLPEGDELKAVRKELIEVSREHRACWKLIDQKCREFYEQKEKADKAESPLPNFNISTYRTYICEKANLEKLTDQQFLEVQHRVDAMLQAGIALSEETLKKLRAKGIKC
jgi:hypothetical protein